MKKENQKLLSFSQRSFLGVSQSDFISKNHPNEQKHKNVIWS